MANNADIDPIFAELAQLGAARDRLSTVFGLSRADAEAVPLGVAFRMLSVIQLRSGGLAIIDALRNADDHERQRIADIVRRELAGKGNAAQAVDQ